MRATPTEKMCNCCRAVKPATEFSAYRNRTGGKSLFSYCQPCRRERARGGRAAKLVISPTAWIRPRDDRPIDEKQRDVQLGRWARNVEPGQPAWRVA